MEFITFNKMLIVVEEEGSLVFLVLYICFFIKECVKHYDGIAPSVRCILHIVGANFIFLSNAWHCIKI